MVVLRLGKVNNLERKFIPTKKEYLGSYLNSIEMLEEYELTQTYKDGFKYRRYNDHGKLKYTRNNKMGEITEIKEITEEEFNKVLKENNNKAIIKTRKYYIDGDYEIDADYFKEPIDMVMIEVASNKSPLEEYNPPKGFIEVSAIDIYQNSSIYNGSIKQNNIIIEGTDGVGKTETIKKLLLDGIICQDRDMNVISKNMLFTIPMELRAQLYSDYLCNTNNHILFLINRNKEELEKRINSRTVLSEFDLNAFKYNQLYENTYLHMEKNNMLHGKLHIVDCTNLTLDEQVDKIREIIKCLV